MLFTELANVLDERVGDTVMYKRHLPRESGVGDSAEVNIGVSDREGWVQDIMGIGEREGWLSQTYGIIVLSLDSKYITSASALLLWVRQQQQFCQLTLRFSEMIYVLYVLLNSVFPQRLMF